MIAHQVAAGARQAGQHGAPSEAAGLLLKAAGLLPEDRMDIARSWWSEAAEFYMKSGESAKAQALLQALARDMDRGPDRADVLRRLSALAYMLDSPVAAVDLGRQALTEAGGRASLRAQIELGLTLSETMTGNLLGAEGHASEALRYARKSRDPSRLARALAFSCIVDFLLGRGYSPEIDARGPGSR